MSRSELLSWLAAQLRPYGLEPDVSGAAQTAVLRVRTRRSRRVRYVACVAAPQARTWAWVWSCGWALINDPRAVPMIAAAMDS